MYDYVVYIVILGLFIGLIYLFFIQLLAKKITKRLFQIIIIILLALILIGLAYRKLISYQEYQELKKCRENPIYCNLKIHNL